MTAASADRQTVLRSTLTLIGGLSLAASTEIFAGTFVCYDTSENIVPADDTAGYKFAGLVRQAKDNSSGSAGDLKAELITTGIVKMTGSGFAEGDLGKRVYLIDDQTVALAEHASVTKYVGLGVVVEIESATSVWVFFDAKLPWEDMKPQIYSLQVAGVNATDFDLATYAAELGGVDLYVHQVLHAESYVNSNGALADGLLEVTTDWTLADGVITAVNDESANTWKITVLAELTSKAVT